MSSAPLPPQRPQDDDLSAPATQIVRDRDAYLGQGARDVGRRLTDEQLELFVSGDASAALLREFERVKPKYIVLHDVGTTSSLRLLSTLVATRGVRLQRLSIRRQGHGVALATLQFVEIPSPDGATLRCYSTDIDADSQARQQMARLLLSHAELGVLVVGDLPAHAIRGQLQPFLDSMAAAEPWTTRQLLLMPLGGATALAPMAAAFNALGRVHATVTPHVGRPGDAWNYIGGAWNRLQAAVPPSAPARPAAGPVPMPPVGRPEPARPAPPAEVATPLAAGAPARTAMDDAEEPTQPMGLRQGSDVERARWAEFILRCMAIKGMVSCCVFDRRQGRMLAHSGGRPPAELLQTLAEQLLASAAEAGAMLGAGTELAEAHLAFAGHHVLLYTVPAHPSVVLHAVIDGHTGNVALAKVQIQRAAPA
jgi:hypothetical protein